MADVLLLHHAHGLTEGVHGFADALRARGHQVAVPDLYGGRVFEDLDEGVAYSQSIGMETTIAAATAVAETLTSNLVYAGFSLGATPAQKLAQTRPGARGALLFHGGIPTRWFETPWPSGVPLQVHVAEDDVWVEMDEVEELTSGADDAELFVYPGSAHLFTDDSLAEYDADSARLVLERTLAFLDRLG